MNVIITWTHIHLVKTQKSHVFDLEDDEYVEVIDLSSHSLPNRWDGVNVEVQTNQLTQKITWMTVTLGICPAAGRLSVRLIPGGAAGTAWAGGGATDGAEDDPKAWG